MAVSKRPSYLKRQKEQQRLARAAQKREARLARKHSKGMEILEPEVVDPEIMEPVASEEEGDKEPAI